MDKTTVYLPAGLRRRLHEVSRRTGRAQADLIRDALDQFLVDAEPPPPRSFGLGDDPELRGADSEDWLRSVWGSK